MKSLKEFIKFSKEQADRCAVSQLVAGQLTCNSLTVNHYMQIGSFVVHYDKIKNLRDDSVVMVLEEKK